MPASPPDNRRYLLRLWVPVIIGVAVLALLLVPALTSGDVERNVPAIVGIVSAAAILIGSRWWSKRRLGRMLHAADPRPFLRSFAAAAKRIPHGSLLASANAATVLALYGHVGEAEQTLNAVSWQSVPPLVHAQESAARAVLAYVGGSVDEGLDYAVAATQQASVNSAFPGAQTSELAFRTYRNLGMALSGRATGTTAEELRTALARLPLLGQVLAAWGLALIARNNGQDAELQAMRSFVATRAPHLEPVLASIGE
jgi:hypothetical protein